MSQGFCRAIKNPRASLYHYRLIKILIVDELGIRNDSWDDFFQGNGFITDIEKSSTHLPIELCEAENTLVENQMNDILSSHPKKLRRRKLNTTVPATLPCEPQTPIVGRMVTRSMMKTT